MYIRLAVAATAFVLGAGIAPCADLSFLERFALTDDRARVLQELVPGTEDYYYFHSLYYQQSGRSDDVEKLLIAWVQRYGETPQVLEIRNRQALLRYDREPEKTLAYLKERLGLDFNQQPVVPGVEEDLPSRLDPALISRDRLLERALNNPQYQDTIQAFTPRAFDWLLTLDLDSARLRSLLGMLTTPDYPNLPQRIGQDLDSPNSGGFGSIPIHTMLMKEQLDELLRLKRDLVNQDPFISTYLRVLRPSNDEMNWRIEPPAREAYLQRLEAFTTRLAPSQNSLKAHVLYHRLDHDMRQGVYDQDRFLEYLRTPRQTGYMNDRFMRTLERGVAVADLNVEFATGLPAIGSDDHLVRAYLEYFFMNGAAVDPFKPYLDETYLRRVYAETMLLQGEGDAEKWFSWLDPSTIEALRNRVDVQFVVENASRFAPEEPVTLDVWVKNVEMLLVNIFEIDEANYYQQFNRRVNTDIELDGLVPNHEEVLNYDEPPLRRVRRTLSFPQLQGRGVWVVECIGNGQSSRAVIEKGRLQCISRSGPAGQMVTVFDEQGQKLDKASVWFSGRTYSPNERGEIAIPFSTEPAEKPIVLMYEDFASLDTFHHDGEDYLLRTSFHVDRESLRAGEMAKVAVRSLLYLNRQDAPLALVEEPRLTVIARTHDGISTTQDVRDVSLDESDLAVHEFLVPENLASLEFVLRGRVDRLTATEPLELDASEAFQVNGIDSTQQPAAWLLTRVENQYFLELRDKTGLPVPGRTGYVRLRHHDFIEPVDASLKTDKNGTIALGPLPGISHVMASSAGMVDQAWPLPEPQYNYALNLHGTTRQPLHIPYTPPATPATERDVWLLEQRDGAFVRDLSDALAIENGYITVSGVPAGDYLLHIKSLYRQIWIRITDGASDAFHVASGNRILETQQPTPLQIQDVTVGDDTVNIQLGASHDGARVHVVATRYVPEHANDAVLHAVEESSLEVKPVNDGSALYQSGRSIGDEYRYILERRFAIKFPGNMLERPSVLLTPWPVQETEAQQEPPQPEAALMAAPAASEAAPSEVSGERGEEAKREATLDISPRFDFLGGDAAVFYNLKPDATGVVTIPRADLHGRHYLQIIASDPYTTVSRQVALTPGEIPIVDLRLAEPLDPSQHFIEQKQIRVMKAGETLSLNRSSESHVQIYHSIPAVYSLFMTLQNNQHLREFNFIARWPQLSAEEKLRQYSKYASHELDVFLYYKDRTFFDQTVRPFLENKYKKLFLDEWLLERDLTSYLDPWRYNQLNAVEKTLLAKRLADELPHTQRHISETVDLIPPNPQRFNALFLAALYGGALGGGGGLQNVVVGGAIKVRGNFFADAVNGPVGGPVSLDQNGDASGARGGFDGGGFGGAAVMGRQMEGIAEVNGRAKSKAEDRVEIRAYVEQRERLALQAGYAVEDFKRRDQYRALYQVPERTREWVETYYYKVPFEQIRGELIPANAFWRDFVNHAADAPFLSQHVAEAANSFAEMMLALAVLDLPFESPTHATNRSDTATALTATGPLIAFYKDIQPAGTLEGETPVMVSQNYFRADDRYRFDGNERFDKFVRDEFLSGVIYGCQITVTNPTSSSHEIELLHQVPEGAIPVSGGRMTKSQRMRIEPYSTAVQEYYFYFPKSGEFQHYPVHASENGTLLAFADPTTMRVVEVPTTVDTESWQYVSQQGTPEQVLAFLREQNLFRIDLSSIAWRMRDRALFDQVLAIVRERHVIAPILWGFGVHHNVPDVIQTLLKYRDDFTGATGSWLESPLLAIDPTERRAYQHVEYNPLVNPRAHYLKDKWGITNDQLELHYRRFLDILAHRPGLDQDDLLAMTYYMLLQDRVADALHYFERLAPDQVVARLQYDYFSAYLAMYQEAPDRAAEIAAQYAEYPVERWRTLFDDVRRQVAEVQGAHEVAEAAKGQDQLAATEPRLDLEVTDDTIIIRHENLESCELRFFPVDVETLFTRNAFEPEGVSVFASVRPAASTTITFESGTSVTEVPVPDEFVARHVVIEVEAAGISRSDIRYASTLAVQLIETYGQIQVTDRASQKPLPKVYVKVYWRDANGQVQFYKDGYTDLRGRFDYASSSTLNITDVTQFALLVLSDDHGAEVRTAKPPVR